MAAETENMGNALGVDKQRPLQSPEQLKKLALEKRERDEQRAKQEATFDLTKAGAENVDTPQAVESSDGTGLVNRPAIKLTDESTVHQIENVTLKQEIARKDARIEDLEGQVANLNRTLQITRDQSIKPEQLEELMEMLATNPIQEGDTVVIVPNDNFESTFGYKKTTTLNAKGEFIEVPNRYKFVKGRPQKVSRAIYENLKHAKKLQGIQ